MKKSIFLQAVDLVQLHRGEILGGAFVLILVTYAIVAFWIRRNKLKQFLFANGYTETNFRSKETIYPKISKSKTTITIRGSSKVTSKQVLDDREKWEKFFNIQILTAEDENKKTIIYLG